MNTPKNYSMGREMARFLGKGVAIALLILAVQTVLGKGPCADTMQEPEQDHSSPDDVVRETRDAALGDDDDSAE